ncbi:hypothetical protein V1264_018666 [Littorina saxatilis]|uniref:Alpha/beta hydrolase fold-3 domain-containing protein n=2 Tax=Littorina saxatilis TaxID=31220 RepID=A0AAN9GEG7_9CAEN
MADSEVWGEVARRYEIHEETLSYFRRLQGIEVKPYGAISPEEIRAHSLRRSEVFAGLADFEGSEREFLVPSESGNQAGVPISVYKPSDCSRVPAILVYFHGGGLVASSRITHSTLLKIIARRARCIVVNVEFRLAPEHKVPAAFNDSRDVTRWVLHNKVLVGGHADSCVGLGGDSCGGQLTASITHDVMGLDFQILVYPLTDLSLSTKSYEEFADTAALKWVIGLFLANEGQRTDPVVSPYHRPSFTGLPPALCILAQLDPLRDDGLAYCNKLKEAGVPTEVMLVEGAPHNFFSLPAHFQQLTKEAYTKTVEFIQRFQTQ